MAMYLSVCVLAILGVSGFQYFGIIVVHHDHGVSPCIVSDSSVIMVLATAPKYRKHETIQHALAVPNPSSSVFKYVHSPYRRSNDCNICYADDCLSLAQSRCEYYNEADNALQKDDEDPEGIFDPLLNINVNNLLHDIVEKVEQSPDMECIPYISRYTDCTKENVCLGCKTCHCTEEGRWNCSTSQRCHPQEPAMDVDHRVLIMTIEHLTASVKKLKRKRSVSNNPFEKINGTTLTLEQLSEWIYGVAPEQKQKPNEDKQNTKSPNNDGPANIPKPSPMVQVNIVPNNEQSDAEVVPTAHDIIYFNDEFKKFTTEPAINPHSEHSTIATVTAAYNTVTTDSDYLAFDEVLSNIAIDSKNYSRRKSLLDILPNPDFYNKTNDFDYMLIDDDKPTDVDNTENVPELPDADNFAQGSVVTEHPVDEATKVVIDLLESAKKVPLFNDTDYMDKQDLVGMGFDNNNDIFEFNAINIMKRDITGVTESLKSINITNGTDSNITDSVNKTVNQENKNDLKNNVLLPLIKLINNKENEIETLKNIKGNLISFMNYYNQSPIVEIIDYPNISDTNILHDIEMFPDLGYDLRRSNTNVMRKFIYKLKSDIYEVIKDIIGLERHKEGRLPDDLSLLIHSLKRYVTNTKHLKKHLKAKRKPLITLRRSMNANNYKCLESTFKQCIMEIFQTVDKDMPKNNALGSLSAPVKRMLRHIIRTYNKNDFTSVGHRVADPNYNMTTDLEAIGSDWQDMASNPISNYPQATMYKMKLLHYYMEKDINKMQDILMLVEFAKNRRFRSNLQSVSSNVLEEINKGLNSIHNKVEVIVHYHAKHPSAITKDVKDDIAYKFRANDEDASFTTPAEIQDNLNKHKHKRLSFIKQIRNLLKSSKKDIGELLHRNVPKSEIVKQLAKQKLNDIAQQKYNEYEQAMRKWQKNLGVMPRYKRNTPDQESARMLNIIPKYLRRKVHPVKKNSTHKSNNKRKQKKKHNGHKKNKKTTLTTATTPSTITTKKTRTTQTAYKSTGTTKKSKTNQTSYKSTETPKKSRTTQNAYKSTKTTKKSTTSAVKKVK